MQIKSKQRETTNKRNCEGTRGGGRWGFSSKCSWDIQVSHSVDWSPVKLHLHPQISGETALIQHWSGVYFPLEPGARGSGLLISTTPKKHNKKAKIHHKHTVDEVLEELRYKNQSILFTWLLLSSDKHLGIVGLWGCIAHSCIVLTARLENSCFVVVFSLSFFFKSSKITTCCISLDLCTCLLKRNHRQTSPQSATNVFFINAASCNQTAGISSNPSYERLFLTHKGEVKVWERKKKRKKKETKPTALERKLKCQARARFESKWRKLQGKKRWCIFLQTQPERKWKRRVKVQSFGIKWNPSVTTIPKNKTL